MNAKTFLCKKVMSCKNGSYAVARYYPYSEAEQAAVRRLRKPKYKETLPKVKVMNDRRSRDLFEWLLQNNFDVGDLFLTLTFGAKLSAEDRQRLFTNFLKRLRRLYKKIGLQLKYIAVTETGERNDNLHYHLIVNSVGGAITADEIRSLWGENFCDIRTISKRKDGLLGLAIYLMKEQQNTDKFKRSWTCSKNLRRPEITVDKTATVPKKHLKKILNAQRNDEVEKLVEEQLFKGWKLVSHSISINEVTGRPYVQFKLIRKSKLPPEEDKNYDEYIRPIAVDTSDYESIL